MQTLDYAIIILFLVALLAIGFVRRLRKGSLTSDLILGGRQLTLPALVASLVSTWYGGILGVGEYSFQYGLSNWLVFGVPYYLAAFLFAIFLAKKARRSALMTIPERLAISYDSKTALAGSSVIFFMTVPAAYILMLGVLGQFLFGWPFWVGILIGTLFSVIYVSYGGFSAVVRTDLIQFGFMFLGFAILLVMLVITYGGWDFIAANVPSSHLTWHGGNEPLFIAVWYVIALATLIEPAFYQRCYAAKTETVARNGILVSIVCWAIFDFLTTSCGLYARAILPDLADPVASYPALALQVLPTGLLGIFALALLSTVMSTVDSYSFLAATTFGNDIVPRLTRKPIDVALFSRIGLFVAVALAVTLAVFFRSVVDIWYVFGSVGTPALLIPVFTSFVGSRRMPSNAAFWSIIVSGMTALVWYLLAQSSGGEYWLGLEPIFPGLVVSLLFFGVFGRSATPPLAVTN